MADLPPPEPGGHIDVQEPVDPCEKVLTWRRYKKTKPVQITIKAAKKPRGAPDTGKLEKDILAELTKNADATIKRLNSRPVPKCGKGCEYAGSTSKKIEVMLTVRDLWSESYALRDANGNVVLGTAQYLAEGTLFAKMTIHTYYCAPILGDPAQDFFDTSDRRSDQPTNLMVGYNLRQWYKSLPAKEKENYTFKPAKKK